MMIFSYGSNMHLNRIKKRVPSAKLVAVAYITKYQLRLHKVSKDGSAKADAFFTDDKSDIIWGTIIEINEEEKLKLDRAEGLGYGYNEKSIAVHTKENEIIKANIYVADEKAINPDLLPFNWYLQYIIEGAKAANLPKDYQEFIKTFPSIIDKNETRRSENLLILKSLNDE